jgi:pilus assembly protein Flp/PilA
MNLPALVVHFSAGRKLAMNHLYVNVMNWLAKFDTEEEGQGMVEYALILVLVSVVAIVALTLVGSRVTAVFNSIANSLSV